MKNLLIIGAGGHGKVVADAAKLQNQWEKIAFLDDDFQKIINVNGYAVLNNISSAIQYLHEFSDACVAIGNNEKRLEICKQLFEIGFYLPNIIHPTAVISDNVSLSSGSVIFANSVINPNASIGNACIINTAAVIEHDCILQDGVHISPNAALAGGVNIGKNSWIGMGSNIIGKIQIGSNVIVGAGSVVINNIPDNKKVAGVPAREINHHLG